MIVEGDVERAISLAKDAIALARTTTRREELAFCLGFIAPFEQLVHPDDALTHALEGVALARECDSPVALLYPLLGVTMASAESNPAQSLAAAEECIRIDRSQRRTWSAPCRAQAARTRLATGDTVGAYNELRDLVLDVAHNGDRVMLSSLVLLTADTMTTTAPQIALQLVAIYESNAIAAWGDFTFFPAVASLANEYPAELEAARDAATKMTYSQAIDYVVSAIETATSITEPTNTP
jgi:hypothetical protein